MKDKHGFLLAEETLKIVIAVISIGFLIYLLASLYFNHRDNQDLELAKATLGRLVGDINAGVTEVEIYNPENWWVSSWPFDVTTGYLKWKKTEEFEPVSCKNMGWESCICICKKSSSGSCDENGICQNNEKGLIVVMEGIEAMNPTDRNDGENSIKISKPPLVLKIRGEKISK
ncbi:MAG: hypothetical protein ABIA78_00275 [archaeon]